MMIPLAVVCFIAAAIPMAKSAEVHTVPFERLAPTQGRISLLNIHRKEAEVVEFMEGSYYNETLPGVMLDGKYHMLDGHHTILAARRVGAATFSIEAMSEAEAKDFKSKWYTDGHVLGYPYDMSGEIIQLPNNFDDLDSPTYDDDLRYYFGAMKLKTKEKSGQPKKKEVLKWAGRGCWPVWEKRKEHTPHYVEFALSDFLGKDFLVRHADYIRMVRESKEYDEMNKVTFKRKDIHAEVRHLLQEAKDHFAERKAQGIFPYTVFHDLDWLSVAQPPAPTK